MARVNVEQVAFGDPRFARLGQLLVGDVLPVLDLQRLGLGHMAAIWNVCQERGTKTLQSHEIDLTIGKTNASSFVIEAGLAQHSKGDLIRIKGTRGRVEWLTNRRKDGSKGGRPRKPKGFQNENGRGAPQNNPPAPALTPALSDQVQVGEVGKKKTPSSRPRSGADKVFADDSVELKAAMYLFAMIRANNADAKKPDFQAWARRFDLLFRVDGRDPKDVRTVIDWCQSDPFWLRNVLSPDTLRKQYDRLKLAMTKPAAKRDPQPAAWQRAPKIEE